MLKRTELPSLSDVDVRQQGLRLRNLVLVAEFNFDYRAAQLGLELGGRSFSDDLAAVDDDEVMRQAVGLFQVLRRQQNGGAVGN